MGATKLRRQFLITAASQIASCADIDSSKSRVARPISRAFRNVPERADIKYFGRFRFDSSRITSGQYSSTRPRIDLCVSRESVAPPLGAASYLEQDQLPRTRKDHQ
jgi:hypothetical protein